MISFFPTWCLSIMTTFLIIAFLSNSKLCQIKSVAYLDQAIVVLCVAAIGTASFWKKEMESQWHNLLVYGFYMKEGYYNAVAQVSTVAPSGGGSWGFSFNEKFLMYAELWYSHTYSIGEWWREPAVKVHFKWPSQGDMWHDVITKIPVSLTIHHYVYNSVTWSTWCFSYYGFHWETLHVWDKLGSRQHCKETGQSRVSGGRASLSLGCYLSLYQACYGGG